MCHLADEHPNLMIKIKDVGLEIVIERVRTGPCDLSVGGFSGEDSDVESQTALHDQLMVFVSPFMILPAMSRSLVATR